MNRPTGLVWGPYTRKWLCFIITYEVVGWEYDDYITTKERIIDISFNRKSK